MGTVAVPSLEVATFMVDILCVHPINLIVSLVNLFKQSFRLLTKVSVVLIIALVKEVVCI